MHTALREVVGGSANWVVFLDVNVAFTVIVATFRHSEASLLVLSVNVENSIAGGSQS